MSNKKYVQIEDICEFVPGAQPPKSLFVHKPKKGYVRLIQIRDRLNDNFITFIPEETTTKFVEHHEILIGRYGPPIFQVFRGFKGAYNVALMKAMPKKDIDNDYLYYFLQQKELLHYVESMSLRTAGQTGVQLDSLYQYPVLFYNLSEQKLIAKILKTIDAKISNNTTICSDLEAMAKLLYDYWFVQFDFPDENGKPYKSSGGKMVWNEELKREIPDGWEVKSISEIGTLETNAVFPDAKNDYYHYSIPAFDENKMPVFENGEAIASNKYIVPDNCVLVSKLNPQFKRIWLIRTSAENSICSTEFLPIKASADSIAFLYATLYSDAFSTHLKQKAISSTGSRKRIDPDNCMSFRFAFNSKVASKYQKKTIQIFDKIVDIPSENQKLVSLRDFLLPMLMNGQVIIK